MMNPATISILSAMLTAAREFNHSIKLSTAFLTFPLLLPLSCVVALQIGIFIWIFPCWAASWVADSTRELSADMLNEGSMDRETGEFNSLSLSRKIRENFL